MYTFILDPVTYNLQDIFIIRNGIDLIYEDGTPVFEFQAFIRKTERFNSNSIFNTHEFPAEYRELIIFFHETKLF